MTTAHFFCSLWLLFFFSFCSLYSLLFTLRSFRRLCFFVGLVLIWLTPLLVRIQSKRVCNTCIRCIFFITLLLFVFDMKLNFCLIFKLQICFMHFSAEKLHRCWFGADACARGRGTRIQ